MKQNVVIIGAGIGGLATGALLGKMGYDVTILEKEKVIGGYAKEFTTRGFTFSAGPHMYLMPDAFDTYFSLFKKKPEILFKLKSISPQCRFFFSATDVIDLPAGSNRDKKLRELLEDGESQYDVVADEILYKHTRGMLNILSPSTLSELSKLPMTGTIDTYVSRYVKNKRLKAMLLYPFPLLGLDPKRAPAFYWSLLHADLSEGILYPLGGIHAIVVALERLCVQHGVTIKTGREVQYINVVRGRATHVHTSSREYKADIVISNADYETTEDTLIDKQYRTYASSFWKKQSSEELSTVLHLGIKGKMKSLKHINRIDHSLYLFCPSKTDPQCAPKGNDGVSIISLTGMDAETIITTVESATGESIRKRIIAKKFLTYERGAFGPHVSTIQSALLRPSNKSKKIRNMYYVGHHTSPGAGVPLCLISSQLVAERIRREQ